MCLIFPRKQGHSLVLPNRLTVETIKILFFKISLSPEEASPHLCSASCNQCPKLEMTFTNIIYIQLSSPLLIAIRLFLLRRKSNIGMPQKFKSLCLDLKFFHTIINSPFNSISHELSEVPLCDIFF